MNPQYKIQITATLVGARASQNIEMRLVKYIPFVPREGDMVRLLAYDEDIAHSDGTEAEVTTVDIPIGSILYDFSSGMFLTDFEDTTILDGHFNGEAVCAKSAVRRYESLGFGRVNYPQAQAVR